MDTTELEVKDKEPKEVVKEKGVKDRIVGFVCRHKKKIIIGASVIAGAAVVAYVWIKSSKDSDEDNDCDCDGYDVSFDSNPYVEIDEGLDEQTSTPRNYPKRDIAGIDVTGSRFMDYEKQCLEDLSTQYDRFKGKEQTIVRNDVGFCSDGKYTRETTTKYSFLEDNKGINVNISYQDDDGQTGESNYTIDKGRDIINFLKENKNLKMFADVQDVVDMYPRTNSET
jgi:hypothetical protein